MDEPLLRIGRIAELVGISPDSIRHYERLGLLQTPLRTSAGYRLFSPAAVERVRLIHNAVRLGFSLRQLVAFLRERQAGLIPCRSVRAAAKSILERLDNQIVQLQARQTALRLMLRDWDKRLARTPANQPARLLEHLGRSRDGLPRSRRSNLTHPR